MNKEVMFSSVSEEWETPFDYFNSIVVEFGQFDIDAACSSDNVKASIGYDKTINGLEQEWKGLVWCNPPYGRGINKWVEKGYNENFNLNTTIIMLLPARTDTRWFHDYCIKGEVRFIKGRLKFSGQKNNAPFPSMLVIFRNG